MKKGRLEAFSDGVLAIIITIMVLEFKAPENGTFEALKPLIPKFISYLISFVYVGIYWNNHHHLFQIIEKVNGKILWANLVLLFWLSILPFATGWMGENHFAQNTVAAYGFVLMMCAISFNIVQRVALKNEGPNSPLAEVMKNTTKETISTVSYFIAIAVSFFYPMISLGLYFMVAMIWLIPDTRMEKSISKI